MSLSTPVIFAMPVNNEAAFLGCVHVAIDRERRCRFSWKDEITWFKDVLNNPEKYFFRGTKGTLFIVASVSNYYSVGKAEFWKMFLNDCYIYDKDGDEQILYDFERANLIVSREFESCSECVVFGWSSEVNEVYSISYRIPIHFSSSDSMPNRLLYGGGEII